MTFDGRKATTLTMLAIFAAATALATQLPTKAAFMPLLVGVPGTLLCLWQLIIDLRRAPEGPGGRKDKTGGRSETEMFVWLGLFASVLVLFGFVLGGPVLVTAFVRYSSRDSWRNALVAGAGTLAVLWGMFIWLLELPLFPGLILDRFL